MQLLNGIALFSASDLVNYLGCEHATAFDLERITNGGAVDADDAFTELLQQAGLEHERTYRELLESRGLNVHEITAEGGPAERAARTVAAMERGEDVIYQGALFSPPWHGYSDFLIRVDDVTSNFGTFAYDIADTKLARGAKPKHLLQLCVYADLLKLTQGVYPGHLRVALGNGEEAITPASDLMAYYTLARRRFEAFTKAPQLSSGPEPVAHCAFCHWKSRCRENWEKSDHLSLVANIMRVHREKLVAGGLSTMRALGQAPAEPTFGIRTDIFERLSAQARLQTERRDSGDATVEYLPVTPGRGFTRLPASDPGDLFFDIEGDPLFDGGLEYLFGLVSLKDGQPCFEAFWAHDRIEEKVAFEAVMDRITVALKSNPKAHVYHYASYEESALKRLAMYHGTREAAVDDVLRGYKLVDLFKVVREGIRVGEPSYSLKNVEAYYLDAAREGPVTTASDSVVMYTTWKKLRDDKILKEIKDYNEADCISTWKCRDWLLSLRPADGAWISPKILETMPERDAKRLEAEARTAKLVAELLDCEDVDRDWRELLCHLLEFHRREAKPSWWAYFDRVEMSEEELIDDTECIGAIESDGRPARADKKSMVYGFTFPAQDFKMRVGDKPVRPTTAEPAGEIVALDEKKLIIELKLGPSRTPLGAHNSLIPPEPIPDKVLREAVYRYAEAVARGGEDDYSAITDVLRANAPRIGGRGAGAAVVADGVEIVAGATDALRLLDQSALLVQGPPGAGKTYLASHAIIDLIKDGKRVGVASNSHKAINALLKEVERCAEEKRVQFKGIKRSAREEQFLQGARQIENSLASDAGETGGHQLVAGTAWLFARPKHDRAYDYLFIDEAGQVSLANVVAMGVAARNIVLIGDQMQLAQPIQGVHPGGSGVSALEHMQGAAATVAADRGVFLSVTRRMHPDICRFISDAVYEGKLHADEAAKRQKLILDGVEGDDAVTETGIRFVNVTHQGCAQRSSEEAERLRLTYERLLGAKWIDRDGATRTIGTGDILVVTPYNMQANLLQSVLPAGARVGTVDKFQGQEAPVVLISMTTSSGEDLPRNIDFLFSRNRLNVAISRARCLAVIFANPRLFEVQCSTVEQMQLVNTLAWAKLYSETIQPS